MSSEPVPIPTGLGLGSPLDLAKELGEDGINQLLEIVCAAYNGLLAKQVIRLGMSEDKITEELYAEIMAVWATSSIVDSIRPIHQKGDWLSAKDGKKPPTIDIVFRDSFERDAFFAFECKLLKEEESRLFWEYVKEGLDRYLQGKYCASGSAGSLIGYVMSGKLTNVVEEVRKRVDVDKILEVMKLSIPLGKFNNHYVSIHSRENSLPKFFVHHLFFSFVPPAV